MTDTNVRTYVREAWWCTCAIVGCVAPIAGLVCLVSANWKGAAVSYFLAYACTVFKPSAPVESPQ
jgi:hypothetical protein